MRVLSVLVLVACSSGLLLTGGCEFPYNPPADAPVKEGLGDAGGGSTIRLRKVNTDIQICNPSITQDDQNYPGCMLWLNFAGKLSVKPGQFEGEYTIGEEEVKQHDRLTISDTSNTVRWYVMRPDKIKGDLQDPEWSTHPDYIATMGETDKIYSGYAVSISNKTFFKFNDKNLTSTSTPHLWVPDRFTSGGTTVPASPQYDETTGMVDKASVKTYFGTDTVRVLFSLKTNGLTIHYIDYSVDSPTLTALPKPEGRESWSCESALFSPDGKWVVYNCINWQTDQNEAYVQRLAPDSKPVLVDAHGGDPHWWKSPNGSLFVTYYGPSVASGLMRETFAVGKNDDGILGSTYKQKIILPDTDAGESLAAHTLFESAPRELLGLPFKGGLSRDGRFLCTGYIYAYMYVLP